MVDALLHALIATRRACPTVSEVAEALGVAEVDVFDLGEPAVAAGLVQCWHAPDGFRVALSPLAAWRLGLKLNADGSRWVPAAKPDRQGQCGHGRTRTINATDGGLDLGALPDRRPSAHLELLMAEVRRGWAERRRVERRASSGRQKRGYREG